MSERPSELRQALDRELLAAVAERRDRRESVRADKTERRQQRHADAYTARLAARMEPFPDPRNLLPNASLTVPVAIRGAVSGALTIGEDLFTLGKVLADGEPIADTADYESACYVKAVLSHDPALREVDLPLGEDLSEVMQGWTEQSRRWWERFDVAYGEVVTSISDPRVQAAVHRTALTLLYADEAAGYREPEGPEPPGYGRGEIGGDR